MKNTRPTTFSMDVETKEFLAKLSIKLGKSKSEIVRDAVYLFGKGKRKGKR